MMSIIRSRREIEILLDGPDQRDYVVSAYADLSIQDGFHRYVDRILTEDAKALREAIANTEARKDLDANIDAIREAFRANRGTSARGLAIFSGAARGLMRVIPLEFPVENHLVIDEDPFLLPMLEHWHVEPFFLIALVDSKEAHLFDMHHSRPVPVRDLERGDTDAAIQRDKPRFTYKKRFLATFHERQHGAEESPFFREVASAIEDRWGAGDFTGLVLLGRPQDLAAVRTHLPRTILERIAGEAPHAMTDRPDEIGEDVARIIDGWRAGRDQAIVADLRERWKEKHLVANGPTDVLDALQQGRAAQVVLGTRCDISGAHCTNCGYRFGAPVSLCPYCQGLCRTTNALQDILRLAMRHRVPVDRLRPQPGDDPLAQAGGVAAILHAEANWAPSKEAALASEGHPQST